VNRFERELVPSTAPLKCTPATTCWRERWAGKGRQKEGGEERGGKGGGRGTKWEWEEGARERKCEGRGREWRAKENRLK